MNRSFWLAGLAGATILFVYSAISWMVLPWNEGTLKAFPNAAAVGEAMSQVKDPGMYLYPGPKSSQDGTMPSKGPRVFAAVSPEPPPPMGPAMGIGFLIDLLSALTAAWLLMQTRGLTYWRKVCFVAALGFLASIFVQASAWNWFGYTGHFTLVQILDTTLSFGLAGLGMARILKTG